MTGSSPEVEDERVLEDVGEIPLRQQERHLSDDVIKLFEGMEKQFTERGVPFIRPLLPEESVSGQALLERLKALPAIKSPKTMVVPYLEDDDDVAIKNQLRFNKGSVIACLSRLQTPHEQTAEFNEADMQILQTKLTEIRFLAELVPSCGADAALSACLNILIKTYNSFNTALHAFLPDAIGRHDDRPLSKKSLQDHQHQMQMLGNIEAILVEMGVDAERLDGDRYATAHVALIMNRIIGAIQRYYDRQCLEIDIHRLWPLAEIRQRLQQTVPNGDEATQSSDLRQTLSASGEQTAIQLGFDTFSNALSHIESQTEKIKRIQGQRLSIDLAVTSVKNLRYLEDIFFSSQQSSEASKHEQLLNKTEEFLVSMNNLFKQALEQHSMATAMRVIETVQPLAPEQPLGRVFLEGTDKVFAHGFDQLRTALLGHFEQEVILAYKQVGSMLAAEDTPLLMTQDNSDDIARLLTQLCDCEQNDNFPIYFEQSTVNVQKFEVKAVELHTHVAQDVMDIFKRNEQHLQAMMTTRTLPKRIARVNKLGSLAYSLRFFEQMAFVGEKLAQDCQDHRGKTQDFMRGIAIDLEKILAQTVTLDSDRYDLISNYVTQLQTDQAGGSLQPWVGGLHLTHDIHQRLKQALKQRVERLLEQGEQLLPADINKPENIETTMEIKRELALIVDLPDGMVEQTLKQNCVAFVEKIDKKIQQTLKKIQFMFDANPGNTLVDVTLLSNKLTKLLEIPPAEVDKLLDTAKQAFADSQQQGSGETQGQERERCVNATHDYVKTMHQGNLRASHVVKAYDYLAVCQKLEIHQVVVWDARNMVDTFVHVHADFVNQACNNHMELIENYQQETTSQDVLTVAVQDLRGYLDEYKQLKDKHPEIYNQISQQAMQHYAQEEQQHDLMDFWKSRLLNFNQKLGEKLQQAIIFDASQTDEADINSNLAKQVAFCEQLSTFDDFFIGDDTGKGSFSALHQSYNEILIHRRLPQLRTLFSAFAQQDYDTVEKNLNDLKVEQQVLYGIATDYLQAKINEEILQLQNYRHRLENTQDVKPTPLKKCAILKEKLKKMRPVMSHMPQSIKDKRQNMLDDLPYIVTAWSERHIALTKKAVNDLNFGEAAQRIVTLREFITYADDLCPLTQEDLDGLVNMLDTKLEALNQQYKGIDVLEWGELLPCRTSQLFESLAVPREIKWQGITFGERWENISRVIFERTKSRMALLKEEHESGVLEMSKMADHTDKITKFWSGIPADESEWTKLSDTLGQAVRDFNMDIQLTMQVEDQERTEQLKRISGYLAHFYHLYFYHRLWHGYQNANYIQMQVVREINRLKASLLLEIREGSFSRESLYALLDYNQYLGEQIPAVKLAYDLVVSALRDLFNRIYRDLRIKYDIEHTRPETDAIEEIEKNLSKLKEFLDLYAYHTDLATLIRTRKVNYLRRKRGVQLWVSVKQHTTRQNLNSLQPNWQ